MRTPCRILIASVVFLGLALIGLASLRAEYVGQAPSRPASLSFLPGASQILASTTPVQISDSKAVPVLKPLKIAGF